MALLSSKPSKGTCCSLTNLSTYGSIVLTVIGSVRIYSSKPMLSKNLVFPIAVFNSLNLTYESFSCVSTKTLSLGKASAAFSSSGTTFLTNTFVCLYASAKETNSFSKDFTTLSEMVASSRIFS